MRVPDWLQLAEWLLIGVTVAILLACQLILIVFLLEGYRV